MSSDEGRIEEVAAAILDGTPVDWDALDSQATTADRRVLRRMKSIAAIAAVQGTEPAEWWGPLRLLERIGNGTFGEVYRAWDPRLDRQVALKLIPVDRGSDTMDTSIIEEGRLLARIRHPNVVTIYGAERIDHRVGLWMEYVDGRTLHQLALEDDRRFSPSEVGRLGQAIAGAVAAVHAAGLLHRDIKAQNVMIGTDGRVALMDFGAGGELGAATGTAMTGTPLYLAPEVLSGTTGPTVQADIYSIGVLLFFLLTGAYPVTAGSLDGLRDAHARGERRSLKALRPDVPRPLRRVVERAIDPDPLRRWPTASALATALARVRLARWSVPAGLAAAAAVILLAAFTASRPPFRVSADAERPQIAVLPLANLMAGADDDAFTDGLTDEIIRNLGTVHGLDVRSRTSSFAFKGTRRPIPEVGQRLRVGYVLEGSVARSGGRLRVNAQLTKVDGDVRLWAERFERNLTVTDIVTIQDDISQAIVGSLRLALDRGRQRRYDIDVPTYELFLRARALAERQGDTDPRQATRMFEKIVASDPSYAPAYAGLVLAYAYLSMGPYQGVPYAQAQPAMRAAALKAVSLAPTLADAHAAMGWVHARDFRWADARREFERAIELNPNLISSYTSFSFCTLQPLGRFAEAEALLAEAARRDPFDNDVPRALARLLIDEGRYSEAVSVLQAVSRIDSALPRLDSLLGRALSLDGRLEESLPLLERRRERALDPRSGLHPWVAFAWVKLGRRADAERLARQDDRLPFRRVIINAALGNREQVFSGLDEMAETEPQRVVIVMRSPELAPYRDDDRFARLLRRFNLEPLPR